MVIIDGDPVVVERFPNGEMRLPIAWIKEITRHQMVLRYRSDEDLLVMMFVKDHLDSRCEKCNLFIEYLPYSRMDRCNDEFVFTLKSICDMINRMKFDRISILEPHSDVAPALLNRCSRVMRSDKLAKHIIDNQLVAFNDYDAIMFPDAGAQKRYGKLLRFNTIIGDKDRDFKTGKINGIKLSGYPVRHGMTVVIVDDLCSFGGTFLMSAKALKDVGVDKVYMVVTHCEKSILKGDIPKSDLIDGVFTTNILLDEEDVNGIDKIKIIKEIY